MSKLYPILFALQLLIFSLSGCSVKEDRLHCPARLYLDLSKIDNIGSDGVCIHISGEGGFDITDTLNHSQIDTVYQTYVPKGKLTIDVFSPETSSLVIPSGSDCPELMMYNEETEIYSEEMWREVVLHKQWALITVNLVFPDGMLYSPYKLEIIGSVCGYLPGGRILDGNFDYMPASGSPMSVRVPRQKDNSLTLNIVFEDEVIRSFALGEYINQSGYDWTKPDLEDVVITIDYARTEFIISGKGWSRSVNFEILI